MPIKKLLNQNTDGTIVEYSGINASSGSASADEMPRLDSNGRLDTTFMPVGIGQDSVTATAGEALSAGDFVYFSATGTVLKADATTIGKRARGYVNASVLNGGSATVFFDDSNTAKTGLVAGATYYLSLTAGDITTTAPTVAGQIVQVVGFSSSATNLRVSIQSPVIRN